MLRATRLLKNDVQMGTIADMLGYESEAAFRKAFKREIGIPRRSTGRVGRGQTKGVNMATGTSDVSQVIHAPREAVFAALLDPQQRVKWLAPDNMKGVIHSFDPREGGTYRMSLTYQDVEQSLGGKSTADTDTFTGRFEKIIPNEKVVEVVIFEADDPKFSGEMRMTWRLKDVEGGTEIGLLTEDIPSGISPADNAEGSRMSLRNLAALLEEKVMRRNDGYSG